MGRTKKILVNAGLINLVAVALLGFLLRTKILFPIEFIDYRNLLTAHGNFALSGWVGFVLMGLLVYHLLPEERGRRKIYDVLLWTIFILSWCMLLGYALVGPEKISLVFSFVYIAATYAFSFIYIRDIIPAPVNKTIKLLAILALVSLLLASLGSIGLALMYMGLWRIPVSYRDASYIFLHFQYNGFFSLGIGAVFFQYLAGRTGNIPSNLVTAAKWIGIATIPSVFLSLLYYEKLSFYVIGGITGIMLLIGAFYFLKYFISRTNQKVCRHPWMRVLWVMAAISFILKMVMQVGTLTPIGHEVYSDRPVIIGFLHMVFLAFASFFILGILVEEDYFSRNGKLYKIPIAVFISGVLANEIFLMIQGIEILLKTNNPAYNWLLWIAAMLLFIGAVLMVLTRVLVGRRRGEK